MAVSAVAILVSCTDENDEIPAEGESEVTISATVGNSVASPNARTNSLDYGNFSITDVTISVDNVRLRLYHGYEDKHKRREFSFGIDRPMILPLVKNGQILIAPIAKGLAFHGIYGSVVFDLANASNVPESHEMFGLSVITKATWFGIPSVMYLDLEDEVEMNFKKQLIHEGAQEIILTLYMDKFLEGVAPSLVADGNGDGLIEVGPDNVDGNGEAYEAIKANVREALVFAGNEAEND